MCKFAEKSYPWILAAGVVGIWVILGKAFPTDPDALLGAAATVASIFASFLGVSKAIILTIKNSKVYKALASHGFINDLYTYLRSGIWASITFAALSILGFFMDKNCVLLKQNTYPYFEGIWIFAGAAALFTYFRISDILFKILKQVDSPNPL